MKPEFVPAGTEGRLDMASQYLRYVVVYDGSRTRIRNARWWETGMPYSDAKREAGEYLEEQRDAFSEGLYSLSKLWYCATRISETTFCGKITTLRTKGFTPTCQEHGGT